NGEAGSDFSRNDILTVYAVNSANRVAGRGSVARDGFWRIGSGLSANTSYTFVLSDLRGINAGIQSPPPVLPPRVARTGENRSFDYQSSGVVDAVSDGRLAGVSTAGAIVAPQSYMNFGLYDRIFANG